MKGAGFTGVAFLMWVGCLAVAGCAGDSARPPTRADQEQIRKDANVTFDKMKEEERNAGRESQGY